MAITMTVLAVTGCAGENLTGTAGSQPVDSTMTAASSTGTVGDSGVRPSTVATIDDVDIAVEPSTVAPTVTTSADGGDAAAAEFTRSLFVRLRGDEPGCTVAVGRGGAVVFAEAYGAARLDPFEPMTVDTVVDIASVSKQFTATAILLLVERGGVDLDAPLSTYLPDLPAWASRPTVAQRHGDGPDRGDRGEGGVL